MVCARFVQWATFIVIEQMQRWRCPTYNPRTTIIAPYSSTEVINAIPDADKELLLFFRCHAPARSQTQPRHALRSAPLFTWLVAHVVTQWGGRSVECRLERNEDMCSWLSRGLHQSRGHCHACTDHRLAPRNMCFVC